MTQPISKTIPIIHPAVIEYAKRHGLYQREQGAVFYTQLRDDEFDTQLPFMEEIIPASVRILEALQNQERLCIYCDYDTDAVTAGAVMYWGLILLGYNPDLLTLYTPDRFTEGYGINKTALLNLAAINDLIISVDCGINSVTEVAELAQTSCDVIITDHHQLTDQIPAAYSVINPQTAKVPNQIKSRAKKYSPIWKTLPNYTQISQQLAKNNHNNYASESITGVGVAWFVVVWVCYIGRRLGSIDTTPSDLNILLPYVAIGTIADCQSVLDYTNRSLIKGGLSLINKHKYIGKGFGALLELTGFTEKMAGGYPVGSQDLAFVFSPLLNSSGRMTHASHSIALVTYNKGKIPISPLFGDQYSGVSEFTLAQELIDTNNERKQTVKDITQEVEDQVSAQTFEKKEVIWLEGEWSKGIIGLIASRIVSTAGKPVIVLTASDDSKLSASLRAPKGFDLAHAIGECLELLIAGGGHPGAAGLSLYSKNLDSFRSKFNTILTTQALQIKADQQNEDSQNRFPLSSLPPEILARVDQQQVLIIDDESDLQSIAQSIAYLEPFGQHFPFPKIMVRTLVTNLKTIGKDNNHIKGYFAQGQASITQFYTSTPMVDYIQKLHGAPVEVVALVKTSYNTWNGSTKLEFIAEKIWIEDMNVLIES